MIDAKHTAEKQCRKFKCGHVQWCPQVMAVINNILFWKSVLKCESGGKVGLTVLATRSWKVGIGQVPYPGELSLLTLKENIAKAYKQFCRLKGDNNRRDTWIAQLIAAQVAMWNCTKKALWQQLQSMEQICKMAQNMCQALNKVVFHKPLLMVIAPSPNSMQQEYHQKAELEQACLAEAG